MRRVQTIRTFQESHDLHQRREGTDHHFLRQAKVGVAGGGKLKHFPCKGVAIRWRRVAVAVPLQHVADHHRQHLKTG